MKGNKRNIILTGFMATGKSSVGRRLAVMLGYDFLDLDTLIAAEAGMPISQIFATQGEAAFRALESRMVDRVAGRQGCVVATGGGTIVNQRNLETLKRSGVVVTLTADPDTLVARIGPTDDRPMLWGADTRERVRLLLEQRAQAYARADLIVDASAQTIDQVVKHILDFLALHHVVAKGATANLPAMAESLRLVLGRKKLDRRHAEQLVEGVAIALDHRPVTVQDALCSLIEDQDRIGGRGRVKAKKGEERRSEPDQRDADNDLEERLSSFGSYVHLQLKVA